MDVIKHDLDCVIIQLRQFKVSNRGKRGVKRVTAVFPRITVFSGYKCIKISPYSLCFPHLQNPIILT